MKSRKIAIVACLLLASASAAFLYPFRSAQLVFKGHTVRDLVYNSGGSDDCDAAMRHFGTNALPDISSALRVRDTPARRALVWLGAHQRIIKFHSRPAAEIHFSAFSAYRGILELVYERWLPPEVADTCAPEIRALAARSGIQESNECAELLHSIDFVKTNASPNPSPREEEECMPQFR